MVDLAAMLATPEKKHRWTIQPGYVAGNFKVLRLLKTNLAQTNKKWLVECRTCQTQRTTWTDPLRKEIIKCKVCTTKIKAGAGGLELAIRQPLAIFDGVTLRILWAKGLDAVALHKKYGDQLYVAASSRAFVKWTPDFMDKPIPPPPELPSNAPTLPEGAIVVPADYINFLVGEGDESNKSAEAFFIESIQKGNPEYYPVLVRGSGITWVQDGTLMSYVMPAV